MRPPWRTPLRGRCAVQICSWQICRCVVTTIPKAFASLMGQALPNGQSTSWATLSTRFAHGLGPAHGAGSTQWPKHFVGHTEHSLCSWGRPCASKDRKNSLGFPLASLRSPKSDRLLVRSINADFRYLGQNPGRKESGAKSGAKSGDSIPTKPGLI